MRYLAFSERVTVAPSGTRLRVCSGAKPQCYLVEWAVIWDRPPHAHPRARIGNDGLHSSAVLHGMGRWGGSAGALRRQMLLQQTYGTSKPHTDPPAYRTYPHAGADTIHVPALSFLMYHSRSQTLSDSHLCALCTWKLSQDKHHQP